MSNERQVPRVLAVVAILFLLSGIASVADVALDLAQGELDFNLGILGIPICFGLRRFSPAWRTCALVFLWVGMLVCPIAFLLGLFGTGSASFNLLGIRVPDIPRFWVSVAAIPAFVVVAWEYSVLTNPRIRNLFVFPGRTV